MPLALLVHVAGSRWKVEDGFAGGKELAALDEHQVRSWTSWHRWTILALLAYAFLSVLASQAVGGHPGDEQLIPLTCHEIRRLFTGLSRQLAAPSRAAALVPVATTASGHRPGLPLPPTIPHARMITKCRCQHLGAFGYVAQDMSQVGCERGQLLGRGGVEDFQVN